MRFVRSLGLFTVLAVLTAGLVFTPASSATAANTTLELIGATSVRKGENLKLNVEWRTNGAPASGKVELQKLRGSKWKTARTYNAVNGRARVVVKPPKTASYRIKAGTEVSNVKRIRVDSYYVKVSATSKTVLKGNTTRIGVKYMEKGTLPAHGDLRLQHYVGGKWKTAYTVQLTDGRTKVTLKPKSTKKYRLITMNGERKSPTITVTVTRSVPSSFTIHGSGFGHGIGMSQYGAYQMAREGNSASKILRHYYQGTKVQSLKTPATIAVQIYGPEPYSFRGYADTRNDTTFAISAGKWSLRDDNGKMLVGGDKNDSVKLSIKGTKVLATVNGKKYTNRKIARLGGFQLRWNAAAVANVDRANGTYKYGTLTATNINGRLNVINELKLDTEYLYGIAEMPSSWGLNSGSAALEAQAITARSYALKTAGTKRKAKCNCDIVDDVRDQNFTGWNKAGEIVGSTNYGAVWRAAVDRTITNSTTAEVLTYAGKPIAAYYFSSSGGRTANSEDVWATKVDWARSVSDQYSMNAPGNSMTHWTRTLSQANAQAIFGLPNVSKIAVTDRYSSNQAKTLTATSASGQKATVSDKADRIRTKFSLPAAWITSIK